MAQTLKFYNQTELAETLGISPRTLEKWRQNGEGPMFIKLGKRVAYKESDISKWINTRGRTCTAV
jgi:predicted site-specific integrase-resolvase